MYRYFVIRIVLYLFPFVLVMGLLLGIAVYIGEAMPLTMVAAQQMREVKVLYKPADEETTFAYKLLAITTRQPEVIVLGSSRMRQFRSMLLNKDSSKFYNASVGGWKLHEIMAFINQLSQKNYHGTVIVGFDVWWFNADNPTQSDFEFDLDPEATIDFNRTLLRTKKVAQELIIHEIGIQALLKRRYSVADGWALGLTAIKTGAGYRNDGSWQEVAWVLSTDYTEKSRANAFARILGGEDITFKPGHNVQQEPLTELDTILWQAKAQGIQIIGILPPFTTDIYEHIETNSDYQYIPRVTEYLQHIFEQHQFPFFDFSNVRWTGGNNKEMYDGWHASELLSARMYLEMLESLPDVLGDYSNRAYLQGIIQSADNPFNVFDNQF